jgi:hypothetical protein
MPSNVVARRPRATQIVFVLVTTPPYALSSLEYRFPALTASAGRAALGGERELALACLMVARVASGALHRDPLPAAVRRGRANAARIWLSSLALPTTVRDACTKALEASTGDATETLRSSLARVAEIATPRLDGRAVAELRRLARGLV